MKSADKLLKLLQTKGASTIDNMARTLGFSRQYIHKLVDKMMSENKIEKYGSAPHVYYSLKSDSTETIYPKSIAPLDEEFLNKHFILIDSGGHLLEGFDAMKYWCTHQQLDIKKTISEYITTRKKYLDFYNNNTIDGLQKLKNTKGIGTIGVDALYYLDFYAIERFGKTRLGTLMHYAKQGQNKNLMSRIVKEVKNRVHFFIENSDIDAILYVPPTIKRQVQIMTFFEKNLDINLPKVLVKKINNPIIIPQKALSKLFERVANARKTFIVPEQIAFNHVLIIDDAIGSGATINEIATKLKDKKVAKRITGLAITGSYKGFEVISEV
jgi:phosphoribosylpyrophosphate synthetase